MPDTVDVSSYNRAPLPSVLDTAQKLGGLQQQQQQIQSGALAIDQQKLNLMNQHYTYLIRELNSVGPNPSADDLNKVAKNAVTMGIIQPDMYANFIRTMPTDPSQMGAFRDQIATKLMSTNEAVQAHYGTTGWVTNNQTITPTRTSTLRGGPVATGLPIQLQVPPTTLTYDQNNNPTLQGPTPAIAAPGTVTGPPMAGAPPTANLPPPSPALPIGPRPGGPVPSTPTVMGDAEGIRNGLYAPPTAAPPVPMPVARPNLPVQPLPVAGSPAAPPSMTPSPVPTQSIAAPQGYPAPTGPRVGLSPMAEAGQKQYIEDQNLATQKLTDIKPALAALDMMKDLRTGPGTETWNKAVAFLKANKIIPIEANDPTAVYQEVNKYMNQYVRGSGTRSDADLAQRELSNPSVQNQINPALIKLTRNTIALDRIQAARAGNFDGPDFTKYGSFRSSFPPKMDERAFILDKMEPDEKQQLIDNMLKNQNTKEGQRFWDSLRAAKKGKVFQ